MYLMLQHRTPDISRSWLIGYIFGNNSNSHNLKIIDVTFIPWMKEGAETNRKITLNLSFVDPKEVHTHAHTHTHLGYEC